jgi:hypothetical protein
LVVVVAKIVDVTADVVVVKRVDVVAVVVVVRRVSVDEETKERVVVTVLLY